MSGVCLDDEADQVGAVDPSCGQTSVSSMSLGCCYDGSREPSAYFDSLPRADIVGNNIISLLAVEDALSRYTTYGGMLLRIANVGAGFCE